MAKDLQGDAELTITGFLIGFCIAQLIWGPISDRYGRRLPLFIGLGLFIIGSVGCALSTDIGTLMLMSLFWLPETLPAEKRSQASVTRAFHNYYALLTNARYMRFTLCLTFPALRSSVSAWLNSRSLSPATICRDQG